MEAKRSFDPPPDQQVIFIKQIAKPDEAFLRGSLNMFPDFFRMCNFIDSTHMKL